MKITRLLSILTVVIVLVLGLTACSSSENADGNSKVRIAHFPNITHSQALIGRIEGKYQNAFGDSAEIEWKTFNAGPSVIEAIFAGEVDIGYIGPGPAINGYVKSSGDLQIIAGATNAGAILVSRKNLKINKIEDLSGKRVAIPQFGNTQDLSLRIILRQNGLKDTAKGGTVEIVQAENPDIKTLLDKGEIDAALVPEPWGSRLINEIGANVVLDYNQVWRDGNYSTALVIARTQFIQEHPDLVEKFLRTHVELTDYINNNPVEAKAIINSKIKELTQKALDKDVLDASFNRLNVTYDPEMDSVIELANLSAEIGFLKEKPDLKNLFNLNLLNKVLKGKNLDEIN